MKVRLKIIFSIVTVALLGGLGWWIWHAEKLQSFQVLMVREKRPVPDAVRYEVLVGELQRWREDLKKEYEAAESNERRVRIEQDARLILEMMLPEMMRCWLGTEYDFNGTANGPGQGKIACGYFVSTVLRDAGFKLDRYKLAQQPSQNILRSFLDAEDCHLKVGEDYGKYVDWVESMDDGVFLVGLDTHVGFIVKRRGKMRFLHSSGAKSVGVVDESSANARALKSSRWRMLGNLTGDRKVLRVWLKGDRVKVVE